MSSHSCFGKAETFHIIKLIDYRMNQQIDFIFDIIRSSKSIFSIGFILGIICSTSSCGKMALATMLRSSRTIRLSRVYVMVVPSRMIEMPM